MKKVQALSREWKSDGVMDDESGELTQQDDVTDVQEDQSQSQKDWDEVDEVKQGDTRCNLLL